MARKPKLKYWADQFVKAVVGSCPKCETRLTEDQLRCLCMSEVMQAIRRSTKGVS